MKISKTNIQTRYNSLLDQGLDDWQARTAIINDMISSEPTSEHFVGNPGDPEYYFTIQTIWNLCNP
jgi:hypothetical protein